MALASPASSSASPAVALRLRLVEQQLAASPDASALVAASARLFGRTRKDITLQTELDTGDPVVVADATQLQQVLLNLLANAGDAMPRGGDLHLATERVEVCSSEATLQGVTPGRFVRLSVADTGVGMDAGELARIFDPFFTTKSVGKGTGLGLASAHGIVARHGGFISVESELGRGSCFRVFLPESQTRVEPQQPTPPLSPGRGELVLLVDDEEQIRRAARRMLERLGCRVLTAGTGSEAVELVRQRVDTIEVVLLDMIMPGMSGSVAFDELRRIAPELRILLVSGYSIDGDAAEILRRGCNGFIQKPYDLETLSARIRDVLRTGSEVGGRVTATSR